MEKYNQKKTKNQEVVPKIAKHVNGKRLESIRSCGNRFEFIADKEVKKRKMIKGETCKSRFCPMCSWRKSKKDAMVIACMMKYIMIKHDKVFIFLTLTVPNCSGNNLKQTIKTMNVAFKNLFKRKEVMQMSCGYMRKLEVTYNRRRHDFHPHFHCVIAVDQNYFDFRKANSNYLGQKTWLQLWRDVTGNQTITQVDVRSMDMEKGVNEIAKYSAKDADYLHSQIVFDFFHNALHGAQVITYNGEFKTAKYLYDNDKLEEYKQIDPTDYVYFLVSRWCKTKYEDADKRLMTDEETAKYNHKAMGASEEFRD